MWEKILIVDDEHEFGTTLAERLMLRDYDAKAIDNVEMAMIELKQWQPDIVLLDLRMPGGFGMNTIRAIKEINPSCKVLMITGHGGEKNMDKAIESGADGFMLKPVEIDELLRKIEELQSK